MDIELTLRAKCIRAAIRALDAVDATKEPLIIEDLARVLYRGIAGVYPGSMETEIVAALVADDLMGK